MTSPVSQFTMCLSSSLRSHFPFRFFHSCCLTFLSFSFHIHFVSEEPFLSLSLSCLCAVREELKEMTKEFDKSEEDLKALQSGVGQIVGEVLRQLTEDKCKSQCSLSWRDLGWPFVLSPQLS